jgi:hypothetical protein
MKLGKKLGLALLLPAGCLSVPPSDNPLLIRAATGEVENPVLIRPGAPSPAAYAEVFESVLNVLDDYFEIATPDRYDGRIICVPKIAPGIERPWLNGTPDIYQRLLATFQTMRYRCEVKIDPVEQGGYSVRVTVLRELKDDPRPMNAPSGSVFRDSATVDRQFEVADIVIPTDGPWIPKGREIALEDSILRQIRCRQPEKTSLGRPELRAP